MVIASHQLQHPQRQSQAAAMSQQLGGTDHVVLSLSLVLHFHLLLYAFMAHHWPQVLHRTNGTKRCHQSPSVKLYAYCTHSTLHPPFLPIRFSYKYGGAYNSIMVISPVYMPPFLTVECARETAMAELSIGVSCGLRWSLWLSSAGQRTRKLSMKVQSVCGQKKWCSFRTTSS